MGSGWSFSLISPSSSSEDEEPSSSSPAFGLATSDDGVEVPFLSELPRKEEVCRVTAVEVASTPGGCGEFV